jgi:hypothetical protein
MSVVSIEREMRSSLTVLRLSRLEFLKMKKRKRNKKRSGIELSI